MRPAFIKDLFPASLILLFSYAALSKLLDFRHFEAAMLVQPFPRVIADFLAFVIPTTELVAAGSLLFSSTRYAGSWLSFILMFLFTGYAALAYFHFWTSAPCPCGGILSSISWGPHLVFNMFFLSITIVATYFTSLERRTGEPKKK